MAFFTSLALPSSPTIENLVAHRLEHRLVFIEDCLGAGKPKRQSAGGGRFFDAARRAVEYGPALFYQLGIDPDNGLLVDAAEIDPELGAARRLVQSAGAEPHRAHRFVVWKHGKHDLAGFRDCLRRFFENSAPAFQPRGLFAAEVVDDELVARLEQISRHAAAHAAGADKSKSLHFLPPQKKMCCLFLYDAHARRPEHQDHRLAHRARRVHRMGVEKNDLALALLAGLVSNLPLRTR